jgi:hypothetical protein
MYELATKTGGANSEAAGGIQLRGMRYADSQFCFGLQSRHLSPTLMACHVSYLL